MKSRVTMSWIAVKQFNVVLAQEKRKWQREKVRPNGGGPFVLLALSGAAERSKQLRSAYGWRRGG
jgi:hypothetical protein